MGVEKLDEIVKVFLKEGKKNTAIALIENGTLNKENIALGTIDTIIDIAKEEEIKSPAIIVIGEVVKQHAYFPGSLTNLNYLFN